MSMQATLRHTAMASCAMRMSAARFMREVPSACCMSRAENVVACCVVRAHVVWGLARGCIPAVFQLKTSKALSLM